MTTPARETVQSILDLVRREIGVQVQEEELTGSVGTSDEQLAGLNPKRVALLVVNLSANAIYIRPSQAAASTAGIRLAANGGHLYVNWRDDLTLPGKEWRCVADGAGSTYYALGLVMY